jgi:all-trans-8'-apo-beta-carotenal 15,15'-oxygenase
VEDYAPLLERVFTLEIVEDSYPIQEIVGEIPSYLQGAYYVNGPARFRRQDLSYRHWLDGDGMVCALDFADGGVHFSNRFVRTRKFVEEERAARAIFRTFGTAFDGDRLRRGIALESAANVSVYPYNGALAAFGEQGLPWELDPATLETRGEIDFRRRLNDVSPFAAHPKFDRSTGDMFNFGIAFSPSKPLLNVYRFDRDGTLIFRNSLDLEYPCSIHDFALSTNYLVFYLSPYILDMGPFLGSGMPLIDSLTWRPELGSRLLIVSRENGGAVASIDIGNRYCLHTINCFESDGRLIVDVLEFAEPLYPHYQRIPYIFTSIGMGSPVRHVVDLRSRERIQRREMGRAGAPDFPSIDQRCVGLSYADYWLLDVSKAGRSGRKFFDRVVHQSLTNGEPSDVYEAGRFNYLCAEPVFIADPHYERRGSVICQMFDAKLARTAFLIFDAYSVASGPVAALYLKRAVPFGFHATFDRRDRSVVRDRR